MKFKMLAATAALALAATATFAQEAPAIALVLTPAAGNTLSTTFQRSVTGLFVDTFSFTPASVSGNVTVTLTPLSGPVNFFAALLNDEGFSHFPESGATHFSFQSVVSASAPLSLTVLGYAGDADTLADAAGTYSGSISVQSTPAIPEPETYALMLMGLTALGAYARRKKPMPVTPG